MPKSYRLGLVRRGVNLVVKTLLGFDLAGRHTYLLTVPGRSSGRLYSTPIVLVENEERWLVAPYGDVSWVKNLRAARRATLTKGRRSEEIDVTEATPQESGPVLRQYLRGARVVRPFFDVSPDSPVEAFVAEAPRHPVFRVTSA